MKKHVKLRNSIGIRELLKNKKTRATLFNFWLIMTGLLYLYYSTIIVASDILNRDNISNWTSFNSPNILTLGLQFAIVSVISHFSIPIICHILWKNKAIDNTVFGYNTINKVYNTFRFDHLHCAIFSVSCRKSCPTNYLLQGLLKPKLLAN